MLGTTPPRLPGAFEADEGNGSEPQTQTETDLDTIDDDEESSATPSASGTANGSPAGKQLAGLVHPNVLAAASKLLLSESSTELPSPTPSPPSASSEIALEADILHPAGLPAMSSTAFRTHMISALDRIERRMAAIEDDIRQERGRVDKMFSWGQTRGLSPVRGGGSPFGSDEMLVSPATPSSAGSGSVAKPLLRGTWALILSLLWGGIGKIIRQFAFFIYLRRLRKLIIVVLFNLTMWAQSTWPKGVYRYVVEPVMDVVFRIL
jgi:hypothetical protein